MESEASRRPGREAFLSPRICTCFCQVPRGSPGQGHLKPSTWLDIPEGNLACKSAQGTQLGLQPRAFQGSVFLFLLFFSSCGHHPDFSEVPVPWGEGSFYFWFTLYLDRGPFLSYQPIGGAPERSLPGTQVTDVLVQWVLQAKVAERPCLSGFRLSLASSPSGGISARMSESWPESPVLVFGMHWFSNSVRTLIVTLGKSLQKKKPIYL